MKKKKHIITDNMLNNAFAFVYSSYSGLNVILVQIKQEGKLNGEKERWTTSHTVDGYKHYIFKQQND